LFGFGSNNYSNGYGYPQNNYSYSYPKNGSNLCDDPFDSQIQSSFSKQSKCCKTESSDSFFGFSSKESEKKSESKKKEMNFDFDECEKKFK